MSNNTRNRVLRSLLLNQKRTVNELAEAVDINPISVRHHVTKLEAEGLIVSEEERHGVGRPRLVFSLTPKGMDLACGEFVGHHPKTLPIMDDQRKDLEFIKECDSLLKTLLPERV